ncbi:sensor histidine kinase [Siphonobacter curvatus]|uniref:histidine kinase n=1 Tax=Siphonobacter curvatus TaxID=2094562 RepID=A0A2S7IE91_9BACT|nr:sensor histidine kinase [Siphonobacter curvatus]PQA52847.1 hypothetical protein C5O19_25555 [Siphonobacter curvatus]
MNKIAVCIAVLYGLTIINSFAQTKNELQQHSDSLYQQLLQLKDQEHKAKALYNLSFFWSDFDTVKALRYIGEAEQLLGAKSKSSYYRGLSSFYRAAVYFDTAPLKAKQLYLQAEVQLKQTDKNNEPDAQRHLARLWGSYGALLQRDGKSDEYVNILLNKVIPLAKHLKDSTLLGNNYQNVAMALMNLKAFNKAQQHYENAWNLLKGRKDADEQLFTLSVNAARNALFRKDDLKSKIFLDKADVLAQRIPNSAYIPIYHSVAGSYWAVQKNMSKANRHFEQGLHTAKKQHNDDMAATIIYDQFSALQSARQYQAAMNKLLTVLPYVQTNKSLRNKQMVYYNLANTAVKLGQYQKAINWYEAHKKLSDTLFLDKGEERIIELEKIYQTTEKEKELLRIKTENQQHQLSLHKTRLWVGILVLAILVLSSLSFTWYSALNNKKKLAKQEEMFLKEEMKNRRQQEKLNLYNAMLQGQERERNRIARDLHDGLGGMLASTKLKLSAVAANINPKRETTIDLNIIISQLDHSVDELRRIARNMMPESLLYMGLEAALRDLCNAMSQTDLQIDFQASNLREDYPQAFLIAVYRILQELLTNAVKHSGASQVWVQCTEVEDKFHINVEDNGKGFDPKNELLSKEGIGISNIRNRVDILNGQLEIDAAIGNGASFHIQLNVNG